ncbi:Reverse transcriptase zinc-binding domain [Arabidopsis suecica]|uniref:Reverse transcriptase zinc-binding domain n=1 Tax=Arabidopsis suecica TaxID=45249 RepID=A0A8T2BQ96_ARASU|nr:Reverse transcriptase zinc-binding domain [Arabidopsis suecica]
MQIGARSFVGNVVGARKLRREWLSMVVSVVAPNTPAMYEMHFAVPMAGAVLNPINTRLDATSIAAILRHAKPKILFIDRSFEPLAREIIYLLSCENSQLNVLVIFIDDNNFPKRVSSEELDYECLIQRGEPTPSLVARMFRVQDEHDPISLNYTSGTTADPKGVVISHRGAYLCTLSAIIGWEMGTCPVYLWTLPMFHCNGWTFTWATAARGGTSVCMKHVTAPEIYKNIKMHTVTHMCCVPTVFNILLKGNPLDLSHRSGPVHVLTGGSPPPAPLVKRVQLLGFQVMHAYGLTEATGPVLFCEWQDEWNREIQLPDGSTVSSQEEIKQEAERFFSEFLGHVPTEFEGLPADILEELIPFKCTNAHQCMLEKEVTAEEIRQVLFAMPANKAPGPDGFTCEFFKSAWSVVGDDFTTAIQSFFIKGFLPKGVNTTILALIPKKEDAKVMKDYRPISCCNVLYKVISKILANRLKSLLPEIISPNQTAFIKNRLLMENVLLASEIVKDYHKDDVSPRCAMKIDISKAFDSVQWSFLLETLKAMHFPGKFIHWIQLCISTATFSVQVNGELTGFFGSKRGLRHGCALSPYLFVICMNVLSQRINKAAVEGKFGYHPRCHNVLLTHLCFADDLMVFAEGTKRSIEGIMSVFDDFAKCSGLKISIEKSTLYMAGIAPETQAEIQQSFPFATGQLPVRYLGLPLMTKAMSAQDYLPLTEKVRARISSWTSRFLSYAGRLQLIRSVLMSITNFWSATFCLPGACMKEIQQLCSAFLWSGPDLNTHKAKTSWETVCLPRSEGGLGLRPLKETNKVCGLKLIWRLLAAPTSMWSKWVHTYLIRKKCFWTVNANSSQGSWMWRKILKLRDLAKNFHRVEIKSGRGTSFWYDTWSSMGKLFDNFGDRGCIDLGISKAATVEEVLSTHKGRRRRVENLNKVEAEIEEIRLKRKPEEDDVNLWRWKTGFKGKFSSNETWKLLRVEQPICSWAKGVWFSEATPKYAFITWLAMHDRLTTGVRMGKWNAQVDVSCKLCDEPVETRNHLFFRCSYSRQIWETLAKGLLQNRYTLEWDQLMLLISSNTLKQKARLLLQYAFQIAVHTLWRERNNRRHGEDPITASILGKTIDKNIRNRITLLRKTGNAKYEDLFTFWLSTKF